MVNRIDRLTPAQQARLPEWADRWIKIGLSCEPIGERDRDKIAAAFHGLYRSARVPAPASIIFVPSPLTLRIASGIAGGAIHALRNGFPVMPRRSNQAVGQAVGQAVDQAVDQAVGQAVDQAVRQAVDQAVRQAVGQAVDQAVGQAVRQAVGQAVRQAVDQAVGQAVDQAVRQAVRQAVGQAVSPEAEFLLRCAGNSGWLEWWGSFCPSWSAWLTFFRDVCDLEVGDQQLLADFEVTQTFCSIHATHHDFVMVSERPKALHRDLAGRLHCADGPAIAWLDGWSLYFWHGLPIPPSHHWIVAERGRLNATAIEAERNVELRRIMLEIYGFDRYLAERDARVVAHDTLHGQPRRLLEVAIGGERIRIIEVTNGSLEPDGSRRKFHLGALRGETPHDVVAASYGIAARHYKEAVRS